MGSYERRCRLSYNPAIASLCSELTFLVTSLCAQPTLRLLYLSISAAWTMSASADICASPNISLSREKPRSAAAVDAQLDAQHP